MSMSRERNQLAALSSTDVGTAIAARDDDAESYKAINNQPLTVQVPLKVGPTKNIYQFTQLRDAYKNKFVQTAQMMNELEGQVNNVARN